MIDIPNKQEIPTDLQTRLNNAFAGRDEKLVRYAQGSPQTGYTGFNCKLTGDPLVRIDEEGRAFRTKYYATVILEYPEEGDKPASKHETPVSIRALPLSEDDLEYLYCCDLLAMHEEDPVDWEEFGRRTTTTYKDGYMRGQDKKEIEVDEKQVVRKRRAPVSKRTK